MPASCQQRGPHAHGREPGAPARATEPPVPPPFHRAAELPPPSVAWQLFSAMLQARAAALVHTWTRFGKKLSWALSASALSQMQTLLVTAVVARQLIPVEFGRYALLLSTLAAAIAVAGLSIGMTTTRCVSTSVSAADGTLERALALCQVVALVGGLLMTSVLTVFAGPLCHSLGRPELIPLLRCAALYVLLTTANNFQAGALSGFLAFRETALVNVTQLFLSVVLTLVLAARFGLQGAVAALLLSSLFLWFHTGAVLRRILKQRRITLDYRHCLADHRPVTSIAIPASAAGAMNSLALWGLTVLYSARPGGMLVIGAFAVATNFRLGTLFVPVVLQKVLAAYLSRAEYRGNAPAYRRLYWRGVLASVSLACAAAIAVFLLRGPLLAAFGRSHQVGAGFFALLLFSGVVEAYGTAVYQAIATTASLAWHTLVTVLWCPALLGAGWFFAQRNAGPAGMAAGLLAAWTLSSIAYTFIARRLLGRLEAACS